MKKMFGTDGVRGEANTELTPEFAFNLGRAGAYVLTKENRHTPRIIIGMDTRISCDMLECALTAGMCSLGAEVICAGVVPTPGIAYLVRKHGYDAGVMISASHNPFADNGIKFFSSDGYKLADVLEKEIEEMIENKLDTLPRPSGSSVGRRRSGDSARKEYIDFLESTLSGRRLDGLRVILDCANGATHKTAPEAFKRLGADVTVLYDKPDGKNINAGCGSTHMEKLSEYMKENSADIGVAFDGDGDRCLMVDENGEILDGDQLLSIIGNQMKSEGRLSKDTIVGTIMSNLGLFRMGEQQGIHIEKTNVGDRYVLERMREGGYTLGGEQSGHVVLTEFNTTGDGIVTALQVCDIMKRAGESLSRINRHMKRLPQSLVNAFVSNDKKYKYSECPAVTRAIEALEERYEGRGRVLIRASGTEPLVRVMIEGDNMEELERDAHALAAIIESQLGGIQ